MANAPEIEDGGEQGPDEDTIEESIEVSGVALVVWAARLSLFLLLQGAIVLASYAYYGFATNPVAFGPGFRLDPLHASINLFWGLTGTVIGFLMPRFSIDYVLAFALFYTALAALGTFATQPLGMQLDTTDNVMHWLLALAAWAVGIYALWQDSIHARPPDQPEAKA